MHGDSARFTGSQSGMHGFATGRAGMDVELYR